MGNRVCPVCGGQVALLSENKCFCLDCEWDDMPVLDVSGQDRQVDLSFSEYLLNNWNVPDREGCFAFMRTESERRAESECSAEVSAMIGHYTNLERKVDEMRVYMRDNPFGLYAYKAAARSFDETLDEIGSWNGLRREAGEGDSAFRSRIMDFIVAKHDREIETMRRIPRWGDD